MRRRFLYVLFAALAVLFAGQAAAADVATLIRALGDGGFDEREKAIVELAASGDPRAPIVLEALNAGVLHLRKADGAVLIVRKEGVVDAVTGAAAEGGEAGLERVRVNNRLRRALEAALGSLTLMSPDARVRREAAEAVFRSRDPAAIPALDQAIAAESDPSLKLLLQSARAAALLNAEAPADKKLAAVAAIAARGDRDALAVLGAVAAQDKGAVGEAAVAASREIERTLAFWGAAQNVWYGISLGSVLLLAAIGLAITFGVMGVINMAHGEMVMLGAYTTFAVQQAFLAWAPDALGWSLPLSIPAAFLVAGAFGVLLERSVIRFLYGRPLETLLATWGLSLIIQQAVRTAFGPTNREVIAPSWMSGAFEVGHLTITYGRLWIVVFSLLMFGALMLALGRTWFGLQTRAVTQNRRMAAAMGVRTARVDAMTFGLGSGIAGIAGVALSQIDNVSPNLGQSYIIDSSMVVVFGGVGNLWGTLVGALTLGVVNKFLEPYAGAVLGKILVLVAIILFIQKRPRGLFALRGRSVEA